MIQKGTGDGLETSVGASGLGLTYEEVDAPGDEDIEKPWCMYKGASVESRPSVSTPPILANRRYYITNLAIKKYGVALPQDLIEERVYSTFDLGPAQLNLSYLCIGKPV
jgi:hypothetical protein